jgi:hypothetical protein
MPDDHGGCLAVSEGCYIMLCVDLCWKVNFKDFEWLEIQTSAKGHRSAYIYTLLSLYHPIRTARGWNMCQ